MTRWGRSVRPASGLSWIESCFREQDLHLIFCSEWVAAALSDIGIFHTDNASPWNPNRLVPHAPAAGNWSSSRGGCDETDYLGSVAVGHGRRVRVAERSQPRPVKKERPTVNLPLALRQSNWQGAQGQGSCTWATMVSLLRWQGRYRHGRLGATELRRRRVAGRHGRRSSIASQHSLRLRHQRRREVPGVGVPHAAGLRHHGHGRGAHGRLGASRRQVGRPLGQQRRREATSGFRERR